MDTLNTEIGTIAGNWKLVHLNKVAEKPKYGYTASAKEKGDTKFLRITDITDFGVNWDTVPYCECSKTDLEKYELKENDILFARIGATTGKTCIVKNAPQSVFASYLIRVRVTNCVNADYLYFFLQSSGYWTQINSSKHDNLKKGVNATVLASLLIPLPPPEEQRKIAAVLSLVQEAIRQQEQLITTATELKTATMQKLFTEGTRGEPQKMTEIGLIPETWKIKKLGKVAKLKSGGTPSRKKIEYWDNGSIPWVKTTEINYSYIKETEEYITKEGLENSSASLFPKGTLLMAMYGQGVTRGRVGILGIDAATNQACVSITPNSEIEVSTNFLYHYFTYQYELLRTLGHGANQSNLSATILKNFPIPFPQEIDEQIKISNILENINLKVQQYRRKITTLQDLFRTLLHQLMTAQIRVDDLDLSALNLELQGGKQDALI